MITVDGYRLREMVHQGDSCTVYRGTRRRDQLSVILKVSREPRLSGAMDREFELLRNGERQGIAKAYDLRKAEHYTALILQDSGGISLDKHLSGGAPDLQGALSLLLNITVALGRVHRLRLVHARISPRHILRHPAGGEVKLIDFANAIPMNAAAFVHEKSSISAKSLPYISPEQTGRISKGLDYRTDLYSLGITFYEIMTGTLPFSSSDPGELVHCHLTGIPPAPHTVNPKLPPQISRIIAKLMEKNPDHRYQSTFGLGRDLSRCISDFKATGRIAPFEIGSQDISCKLRMPDTVIGRESERAELLAGFDRARGGRGRPVFVGGPSGIGKTELVREAAGEMVAGGGLLLSGKFDIIRNQSPYSAVNRAFKGLIQKILTENRDRIADWKERFANAFGTDGQVILDVIPEFETLMGAQPEVPQLTPLEAQRRLYHIFGRLIHAAACAQHPLVLFLDDLQWADRGTLGLLESLAQGPGGHLFIIGAFRDDEIPPAHPLNRLIHGGDREKGEFRVLQLPPLAWNHVNRILSMTLGETAAPLEKFTDVCRSHSGGNPLYLKQYVHSLFRDRMLEFHEERGAWIWDYHGILKAAAPESTLEVVVAQIHTLSESTRNLLSLVACLGNRFDPDALSLITDARSPQTAIALSEALWEELLLPAPPAEPFLGDGEKRACRDRESASPDAPGVGFRFAHDRVRQAAYSLLEEPRKLRIHHRIGKRLLESVSGENPGDTLFMICDHLNKSVSILPADELRELCELNLLAGRRALKTAAFKAAHHYFMSGVKHMDEDCWESEYPLALSLHEGAAEAAYLRGSFEGMDELTRLVFSNARTPMDAVKAHLVRIHGATARHRLLDAVKYGRTALASLGIHFPEKAGKTRILLGLLRTGAVVGLRKNRNLEALKEAGDPTVRAAMGIMLSMAIPTFFAAPGLLPVLIAAAVRFSVRYGTTPQTPYFFVAYGMLLCERTGRIRRGYDFGRLGVRMLERGKGAPLEVRTTMIFNIFIRHFSHHFGRMLKTFDWAYSRGLETGDLEYAAAGPYIHSYFGFFAGTPLPELERELAKHHRRIRGLKNKTLERYHRRTFQMVLNFMGKSSTPTKLAGDLFDEARMLPIHLKENDVTGLCKIYLAKTILCLFFHDHGRAVENALQTEKYAASQLSHISNTLFHFYDSLAHLAAWGKAGDKKQAQYLKRVRKNQRKLKKWASFAPANYLNKWYLVEAERARVSGKGERAPKLYELSVSHAEKNGFLHEEALALELTGEFYLSAGRDRLARFHLGEAVSRYRAWGARAKVRQMETRHGNSHLSLESREQSPAVLPPLSSPLHRLDMNSIIKSAQTLTEAANTRNLLDRTMGVVMEVAGAARGFLLMKTGDRWRVHAEADTADSPKAPQSPPGIGEARKIPPRVVAYVEKTHENVILADAATEGRFTDDPHIKRNGCRSVLCFPLLHKGALKAILYLENNLITDAFTEERVELLKIVASQAAVAIENARLYDEMEKTVAQRTRELKEAMGKAEKANLAKSDFLAKMSHEIRTPMNSILGFSELLYEKEKNPGNRQYLKAIRSSGRSLLVLINNILDLSKIEAGKMSLNLAPVHLGTLIEEIRRMFEVRLGEKGLAHDFSVDEEVPEYLLMDPGAIRQILINLVDNAVKFTDRGHVKLAVNREDRGEEETVRIGIRVSDTGTGMSGEFMESVFAPFEQEKDAGSEGGTGLGLAICRNLAAMMNGGISVRSQKGRGTEFQVLFRELEMAAPSPALSLPFSRKDYSDVVFEPATLLVVDDMDHNRKLLISYLSPLGFTLIEADNGRRALEIAGTTPCDLILLDMKMPEMDGYMLTEILKQDNALKMIPIIAATASALAGEENRITDLCDGYLVKPIAKNELIGELMRFLPHGRSAPPPEASPSPAEKGLDKRFFIDVPEPLREELAKGATLCYPAKINAALERIHDYDADGASFLKQLTDDFQFDRILELMENR